MAGQVVASGAMDPNPLHSKVIPLYVSSAHHHWGRSVESSLAARLKSLNKLSALSPDNPPSQLILSTTAPNEAILATTPSVTLFDYIQSQVIEVHPDIVDFYAALHRDGLPYQLSIISVAHPQPLRVNPSYDISKRLAEQLSFSSPLAKTVMLVSLSDSQVLFGFQAASEIVSELSRVPEFADAVGRPETDRFVHTVKTSTATPNDVKVIMSSLMLRDAQVIANCLLSASKRLQKMPPEAVTENDKLLITLQEVYPNDPACFAVYFLNSIYMKPGQAVFIQPQEPYSILNGELIEVTNNSDAIVYGGLSKSSAQTEVFLKSLSFDDSPVEVSGGERVSDYALSYVPPVPDYQLIAFKLSEGISQKMVETLAPSVILVIDGEGLIKVDGDNQLFPLRAGSVYCLTPQTTFSVTARKGIDSTLHFCQVGVNESAAPAGSSSCAVM